MEAVDPRKNFLYDTLLPIIEKVSWLLTILGLAAKFNLVPVGSIILLIGLSNLSVVYLLSGYKPKSVTSATTAGPYFEPISSQNQPGQFSNMPENQSFLVDILCPKLIGIGGSIVLVGTLFRLMIWNGSANMLIVGTGTILIVALLMTLNQRLNMRAVVLVVLGSIMLYISPEAWVRQFHHDDPILVAKMIYQIHNPRDPAAGEEVRQHLKQKRTSH